MFIPSRSFLKVAALPSFERLKPRGAISLCRYRLNCFLVADFQYYKEPRLASRMVTGVPLELSAEPDNRHDHYAEWPGTHLNSRVPQNWSQATSRQMLQGEVCWRWYEE